MLINSLFDTVCFQSDLQNFIEWCYNNRMTFNRNSVMSFTQKKKTPILREYFTNNNHLHFLYRPEYIKDFGVTFDRIINYKAYSM